MEGSDEGERTELAGFNLNDLLVENTEGFAMFGVDLNGTIVSWNPGVGTLFGYSAEEWVGQSTALIFTEEDRENGAPRAEMERAASKGEAADVRWHVRKDGRRLWADGVLTALYSPDGEHIGYGKVISDETDKKRLELERERLLKQLREEHEVVDGLNTVLQQRVSEGMEELARASDQLHREMNDRLELEESATRLDRELESLTYSISHDLRSPLRGLDGFSQALLEDYEAVLDDTGKSYLRRIRSSAQLIGDLIDNLLELSRLSRREMKWVEVDLSRQASRTMERLRRNAPNRNVEAVIEPDLVVKGDPDMLATLIENLLSNAWKFTSKEEVARIEFTTVEEDGERRYIVRDNGVGFDMRYAGRLFAPFQRLHSSSDFEGSGVGLATARRVVHRHGGRMEASSQPGAGATFWFSLGERAEPSLAVAGRARNDAEASALDETEEQTGDPTA